MANALNSEKSPYLLQHAENPVAWLPWGEAAFARARAEEKPIFLSIGYSTCHWCHVLAHESFENEEVAALLNEHFVAIKVDREERPDVDKVYMAYVQALTGRGGWPLSAWLTPELKPFFGGTYFPPEERHGRAGFPAMLRAIAAGWKNERNKLVAESERVLGTLRDYHADQRTGDGGQEAGDGPLAVVGGEAFEKCFQYYYEAGDAANGGFGGAPKFPRAANLNFLFRVAAIQGVASEPGAEAVRLATSTLRAMARGGIYDQLAGGFARYSVDADWIVPHFEKMLYDNALLLRVYAHWARRTGDPLARRIAAETAAFIITDLGAGQMFTSSLDADAAGSEGSTYVWTPAQLIEVLGETDGRWAAEVFGVTGHGTFEHGASVLQLPAASDPTAAEASRFERVRSALLSARSARPQPPRDDKIVTAWNGLAITALAEAGVALGDRGLLDAAARCASALVDLHLVDGRLRRASLGTRVGDSVAILEDHAMLATGLLALYQLDGDESWLTHATALIDLALRFFADPDRPGRWFDTAEDAEALMVRPADPVDGATPSGAASIAEALLTAAHLVDAGRSTRYREAAAATLLAHSPLLDRAPRAAGHWLAVAEAAVRGPLQVAVATAGADSELLAAARRIAPGGAVVVGGAVDSIALLSGRDQVRGADAAYICRGTVCDLPVTTAAELAAVLGAPG